MKVKMLLSAALVCAMSASTLRAGELGDDAPALKIAEWVKGEKVDLAAGKGKNIYVVEFWATWCPPCRASIPHLTDLQKKYKDKNVVFVGISNEPTATVKPFVEEQGEKMNYVVAVDDNEGTNTAYMKAFNQGGIPHAFIVGKDGKIIWHGHPMTMDEPLEKIAAGTYDLAAAKREQEEANRAEKRAMEIQEKMVGYFEMCTESEVDTKAAAEKGTELLKTAGDDPRFLLTIADVIIHHEKIQHRDYDIAYQALGSFVKIVGAKPEEQYAMPLNRIAWDMLTSDTVTKKDNELALKVAKVAFDCCKGAAPEIVDTYARALWDTGSKAEALKYQKQAVEKCENSEMKKQLEETLAEYERDMNKSN